MIELTNDQLVEEIYLLLNYVQDVPRIKNGF